MANVMKEFSQVATIPVISLIILLAILTVILERKPKLFTIICHPDSKEICILETKRISQEEYKLPKTQPKSHPLVCDDNHRDICHE